MKQAITGILLKWLRLDDAQYQVKRRGQILQQIHEHFMFLFSEDNFQIATDEFYDAFDNFTVVLKSTAFVLELTQDRSELRASVGPSDASGGWADLLQLISYLSQGKEQLQYRGGIGTGIRTEIQLQRLAEIVRTHYDQIKACAETPSELKKIMYKLDQDAAAQDWGMP